MSNLLAQTDYMDLDTTTEPGIYGGSELNAASDGLFAGLSAGVLIAMLVLAVIAIAGMWKVFTKAGKPGWAAIVPFYNFYVLLQIVGRPAWWLALYLAIFIPFVGWIPGLIVSIIVAHDLSKSFGKGIGMTLLQVFLPFVAYPVLGFGNAAYKGPSASVGTGAGTSAGAGTGAGAGRPDVQAASSPSAPTSPAADSGASSPDAKPPQPPASSPLVQ